MINSIKTIVYHRTLYSIFYLCEIPNSPLTFSSESLYISQLYSLLMKVLIYLSSLRVAFTFYLIKLTNKKLNFYLCH